MAMTDNRFTTTEINNPALSYMPDRPSQAGISAAELKAAFAYSLRSKDLMTRFNNLITELTGVTSAAQLGANIDTILEKNVQAILDNYNTWIQDRYTKAETEALVGNDISTLVQDVNVNLTTGVMTITKKDGSVQEFDTPLEKVPASMALVQEGDVVYLRVTNQDGSYTQTNVTNLLNEYTFSQSPTINFSVSGAAHAQTVTASVRQYSITMDMLSLDAVQQIEGYVDSAQQSATSASGSAATASGASTSAANAAAAAQVSQQTASSAAATATAAQQQATTYGTLSESYAVGGTGTRQGEDADNAKYYSEIAKEAAGGDYVTEVEFQDAVAKLQAAAPPTLKTTGTTNNYILTPDPPITAYAAGQRFNVQFHSTNTSTTAFINISGLGNIRIVQSSAVLLLSMGQLVSNGIWTLEYAEPGYFILVGGRTLPVMTQVEAETGTSQTERSITPQRLAQGAKAALKLLTAAGQFSAYDASGNLSGSGLTPANVVTTANVPANPNLLINGDFEIWQRGTSFAAPANAYTADRWKANGSGTVSQAAVGLRVTGAVTLTYTMEPDDFDAISGKTVTLSYSIGGVAQTPITAAASSATVVSLNLTNQTLNWVKLELGSIATPFVPRPIAEELALCQRYYQSTSMGATNSPIGIGIGYTATTAVIDIPLPVTMRIVPTVTWNGLGLSLLNNQSTGYRPVTAVSGGNGSKNLIRLDATSSNLTPGAIYLLTATQAGTAILLDAEIY